MVKQLMGASGFIFVLAAVHMKPCIMIKRIHEHSFKPFVPVLNYDKCHALLYTYIYIHNILCRVKKLQTALEYFHVGKVASFQL